MKEQVRGEFKRFQIPFSGKWKPAYADTHLGEGDFKVLANMRYTDTPGIKSVLGMSKINTTSLCFGTTPAIGYTTQQMNTNGTQTLTASGGLAPYSWSITAGGGSLSSGSGASVIYTAPAANVNCTNNPTIQLTETCGGFTTLQIAINGKGRGNIAYYITDFTGPVGGCTPVHRILGRTGYDCGGELVVNRVGCSNCINCQSVKCVANCCGDCDEGTNPCTDANMIAVCKGTCTDTRCVDPTACRAEGECDPGTYDHRTAELCSLGCCPAALISFSCPS